MDSELDRIKSTITISLGTKNKLRKLKGSQSYEDLINYLIRLRNQTIHYGDNTIELQEFQRVKGLYSLEEFKILFSYNKFNSSQNFIFDISIDTIRENGEIISQREFLRKLMMKLNKGRSEAYYTVYFKLLERAIQIEIEPLFRHNGRFEDYFSWEEELKILNLPKKSFEEDIKEKLREFKLGVLND